MAHCDASFGPLLVRREVLAKFENLKLKFAKLSIADRLIFFTANPDLRVIHCPDCMFYTNSRNPLTKEDLMEVARIGFLLNFFIHILFQKNFRISSFVIRVWFLMMFIFASIQIETAIGTFFDVKVNNRIRPLRPFWRTYANVIAHCA